MTEEKEKINTKKLDKKTTCISLPDELMNKLREAAKKSGKTMSSFIETRLKEHFGKSN